jgi:hypothetical protein
MGSALLAPGNVRRRREGKSMNVDPPTQGRALQVRRTHEARFNREYFEVARTAT